MIPVQNTVNKHLFFRILPVCMVSETSVKVKIQHDHTIHRGICLPGCSKGVSLLHALNRSRSTQ